MPSPTKLKPVSLVNADARRLLMAGAGLLHDPATSPKPLAIIRDLSFIQLDSINVIERAHELILHTRSDAYERETVFRELDRRKLFEHWTHDASLIPIEHYHHWHHRFELSRSRGWHLSRLGPDANTIIAAVLDRIRAEGPLYSRDFEPAKTGDTVEVGGSKGWWNWKPAKAALEYLWRTGGLVVSARDNFQKVYDLPERTYRKLPAESSLRADLVEWSCSAALDRLGIATPAELGWFHAMITLPEAKTWIHTGLASGRLIPVEVDGRTSVGFADIRRRLARLAEPPARIRFLAPFDPLIRDRKRAERLFNFHYRFEAFTPAAKRLHGYYVLPILQGDQLIGRANAKLDRQSSTLHLTLLPYEKGFKRVKPSRVAVHEAAERLQHFVDAERLKLT